PTVLKNITDEMKLMHEETFGPVAPIIVFNESDSDSLVDKVNNTPYGLAAYFYTKDLKRIYDVSEKLKFGVIGVNDSTPVVDHAPFGGMKQSGVGRESGKYGVSEFLESKAISIRLK